MSKNQSKSFVVGSYIMKKDTKHMVSQNCVYSFYHRELHNFGTSSFGEKSCGWNLKSPGKWKEHVGYPLHLEENLEDHNVLSYPREKIDNGNSLVRKLLERQRLKRLLN